MDQKPRTSEEADEHINEIRRQRGFPEDANNTTNIYKEDLKNAIDVIAKGLYHNAAHFILELIQNADDCSYAENETPEMTINLGLRRLRVDYNEVGFTRGDLNAICRVGLSTKFNAADKTGEKGIGFKSVFKVADVVYISSGLYSFKFDCTKSKIGMIVPQSAKFPQEKRSGYTSLLLHLRGENEEKELLQEMKAMDGSYLLFLRKLRKIHVVISNSIMTLSRQDHKTNDELRHITTLSRNDESKTYLVRKYEATGLPAEALRGGRSSSFILLAFPHHGPEQVALPTQQVYTFLPIHDYGFKFLIHADFVLTANRGEIDSSSEWNRALRDRLVDAFIEEAYHFHNTPYRYTWLRYLPSKNLRVDFFWEFRYYLNLRLRGSAIVESEDGSLRVPTDVRYIPLDLRDEDKTHLLLSDITMPRYLSHRYAEDDRDSLKQIGVVEITKADYLRDLEASLPSCHPKPDIWHSKLARLLIPFISNYKDTLSRLPIIPLTDDRWVAASSGKIFFPKEDGTRSVPQGIEVFEVQQAAQADNDRRTLFQSLGVQPFSVSAIQGLILDKHKNTSPDPEPSLPQLISQTAFLYETDWRSDKGNIPFWVMTETKGRRRSHEVYVHSASRYLKTKVGEFPFLHRNYYREMGNGNLQGLTKWFHGQLGLWEVPRLVKRLAGNDDLELSKEFQLVLETCPSEQFLQLLKENWSMYVKDCPELEKPSTTLRAQLASTPVTCLDGKMYQLEETSTGYFLPEEFRSEYVSLQPVLKIPKSHDSRWNFLHRFGVSVNDGLSTYLGLLAKVQGRHASATFVEWLYGEIQSCGMAFMKDRIRHAFAQNNSIFIPGTPDHRKSRWVPMRDCIWEGPECVKKPHLLSQIYPNHRLLFVGCLEIKNASLETFVSEAKTINELTPLPTITSLFKEINNSISDKPLAEETESVQSLLPFKIFPLQDGGNAATGIDELAIGTPDSEWYIADRPNLRKSFEGGEAAILAFGVRDVVSMLKLISVLKMNRRLLSNAAKEISREDGVTHKGKEADMHYRGKVKYLKRLIPKSARNRAEIVIHLERMEIWRADKILLGWSVDNVDPFSEKSPHEMYGDSEGLGALLKRPTDRDPLRLYIRDDKESTCLPLELAEQLATFCHARTHEQLVYFILSQDNPAAIENTLGRRGFLEAEETSTETAQALPPPKEKKTAETSIKTHPEEPKRLRGLSVPMLQKDENLSKVWIGGDDSQAEEKQPEPDWSILTEDTVVQSEGKSDINTPQKSVPGPRSNDVHSEANRRDPSVTTTEPQNKVRDIAPKIESSQPNPSSKKALQRPNYIELDDPTFADFVRRGSHRPGDNPHPSTLPAVARVLDYSRPRIVNEHIEYVHTSQDLPPESFVDHPSRGRILPARAHISKSGDCTIFLALQPTHKIDTYTEFLGELFVSKLLEKHLGEEYRPHADWTSEHRHRVNLPPFKPNSKFWATITLSNGYAMTQFLIQAGYGWGLKGEYPRYHILVKTTDGGQGAPFALSAEELDMIRRYRIPEHRSTSDVVILARVFDMGSMASASFFLDPWSYYVAGDMRVRIDHSCYLAELPRASPLLVFNHFETADISPPRGFRDVFRFIRSYVQDSGETWARIKSKDEEKRYVYRKLRDARNIRLLKLQCGQLHEPLKGELEEVSLESTKEDNTFVALSYVWGNGLRPYTVIVRTPTHEGSTYSSIRITASLHFALRRLRHEKQSCYVWADGICINQDDESEKGHQVRLMSQIYTSAYRVCAWLGEEADDSDSAVQCLQEIKTKYRSSDRKVSAILPATENPIWDAIKKFFERSWFKRVWIVQELVLASRILLVCGQKSLSWRDIYIPAKIYTDEAKNSEGAFMESVAELVAPVFSLGRLRSAYHSPGGGTDQRGLLTLFRDFEHTEAGKSRDKLFALHGLACDADDEYFDPDYQSPLHKVVTKYATVFVRRGKGIDLLYHAGIRDLKAAGRFPSWVPNWVTTSFPRTISDWKATSGLFAAGSPLNYPITTGSLDEARLQAKATFVDEITFVGKMLYSQASDTHYLQEVFEKIKLLDKYPSDVPLSELVWRVPIGDALSPPSGSWDEVNFRASYDALREYLEMGEQASDWRIEASKLRAVARYKRYLFRPDELRQLLRPYLFTAQEFARRFLDAKVCVTRKGYVGIVPGVVPVGGLVHIVHGSAVPFVLLERGPGQYWHFGECYIHGLMRGEMVADIQAGKLPSEIIDIC